MNDVLHALLRQNFMAFLMKCFEQLHPGQPPLEPVWYLQAISHHLIEAAAGSAPRLMITVPPRHLKSIAAAVALPAFLLGRDPAKKIMVASYSQDLARQHSEQCRTILESGWYRKAFATRISERGNRQLELVTTKGGARKAVSVGGSVTGFGADLLIVDDCMKAEEATSQSARDGLLNWFDGTLMTRLNDKARGGVISIQQRLHEDDLPAYLLEKQYTHLNLPAIAERDESIALGGGRMHARRSGDLLNPTRENREVLEQLRRDLGPVVFEAQYQQNPTAPGGNLIRIEWFDYYDGPQPRTYYHKVIQSWDTAATATPTSDWSVCMTWGYRDGRWYLLDLLRERLEYPELKRAVVRLREQWEPDKVVIERASTGLPLAQELRAANYKNVFATKATTNKEERLIAQTAELETGDFVLPREAPWLATLLSELKAFPNGRYDDQVDALSQFVKLQKDRFSWVMQEYTDKGRPIHNRRDRPVRAALRR